MLFQKLRNMLKVNVETGCLKLMVPSATKDPIIRLKTCCIKLLALLRAEEKQCLPTKAGSAKLRLLRPNAGRRGPDGSSMSSEQEQL